METNIKPLNEITVADVQNMDYNNLISLVRETNRIPGGYKTIATILNNMFLDKNSKILEIGTSTGSTSIEIAKILGCNINAIDINERSLAEGRRRADYENIGGNICFSVEDAQNLSFDDNSFDCVICGNVTSLISDREKARSEYVRVLNDNGFLAAVPMYYIDEPSIELLDSVSKAIKTNVQILDRNYWLSFYNKTGLVLKYVENYCFDYIEDWMLEDFITYIMHQDFLNEFHKEVYDTLYQKYKEYIYLFRDNLSHMGYSIMLYKKDNDKEPELFRGSLSAKGRL